MKKGGAEAPPVTASYDAPLSPGRRVCFGQLRRRERVHFLHGRRVDGLKLQLVPVQKTVERAFGRAVIERWPRLQIGMDIEVQPGDGDDAGGAHATGP